MSVYSTGSCKIKAGASTVHGNTTAWTTYVEAGDLFKLTNDAAFYEITGVTDATTLTLNARYRNSNYETSRPSEGVASFNMATLIYNATLTYKPVIQSTLIVTGSVETFTDGGGTGTLAGDAGGSGTIDYDTGALSIIYNASETTASYTILASYLSGDNLTSMPYQIVKDFTTNYKFPEMGLNDINFPTIYTKAMRLIDSALYNASMNQASISGDVYVSATPFGFVLKDTDGVKWRISVSVTGTLTTASFS